jgi:hypothetical protein
MECIIWDIVMKTELVPRRRRVKQEIGITNMII